MRKHYLWMGMLLIACQLVIPRTGEARDVLVAGAVDDQSQTVTGTVKDNEGSAVPGVNIVLKGTSSGTITDADGKYSMNVPGSDAVLVFSFIGFTQQEVAVAGRSTVNVTLQADVKSLDEVVVTALGIERSQKSLGYSTTKVTSEDIAVNRSVSVMNTLQGKIAGVNISSMGTGPAGSSKIRIRGQTSMSGYNSPLLVINGVPMDNSQFGSNPNNTGSDPNAIRGGGNYSDGGDGLSSINPDDIESMNVLKGAAASALYGSRANNGVIMITTKSRGTQKGIGLTYNMAFTDETPLDFTDYQYQYGQGEYGLRPTTVNPTSGQWSFGEKIQPGMTQTLYNTTGIPYVAQKGMLNQFYRHGQNLTNTISISANGEKGGLNLSISNLNSDGIVPNNTFNRKVINLGFNYDLSDRFSVRGSMNYSNEYNQNPPNVANQDNTIPTVLMAMANTMPLSVLRANTYNAAGNEYIYSRFMNRTNPYFTLDNWKQNIRRDRIFGNVAFKYDLTSWLWAQVRVGQDYWSRDNDYTNYPTGQASLAPAPAGFVNGSFTQESRRFRETNADFLLSASKQFGDIGVNVTGGGNMMYRRTDINSVFVQDFVVRGLYTVQNGRSKDPQYSLLTQAVNSLYASAEVNYKKFLYLNATFRNDWFSTLAPSKRSVPYPSISASYVFSESLSSKPSWLDMGKFRAAYAETGSDGSVPPFSNVLYYGVNANLFNSQPVANSPLQVPNPNLSPMRTKETELGIELKMFNNRVGLDLAAYHKLTIDQIVQAQISDGSGYTSTFINSGQSTNQGIEGLITFSPIRSNNFTWDINLNAAYNITKVLSLGSSVNGSNITVGTHVFNGSVQQIVGQEMGQIVGFAYRRDDTGQQVFSGGIPMATSTQQAFGTALPRWVGGLTNTFTYKGVTLSFLIDYKLGNNMLSGTNFNAYREGLHQATLQGRDDASQVGGQIIGQGINYATGTANTVAGRVEDYFAVVRTSQIVEPVIYNGGYIKLRQITVGYDFTRFLPPGFPVKGVRLNFVANNVFIIKKWVDNIDPESFGFSSDNLVGMESPGLLTTRSLGFNLNVKF